MVERKRALESLWRELPLEKQGAGVVDERVDRGQAVMQSSRKVTHRFLSRQVGDFPTDQARAGLRHDRAGSCRRLGLVAADHDNARATRRQRVRTRAPDAITGPGHDDGPSVEERLLAA